MLISGEQQRHTGERGTETFSTVVYTAAVEAVPTHRLLIEILASDVTFKTVEWLI